MSMTSCPVCCESYTQSKRKIVICPHCQHSACLECQKRYLLTAANPDCMQCHAAYSVQFIHEEFPTTWVRGEYAKHREDVLLQRELDQMPASQHLVQHYRLARSLRGRIAQIDTERARLKDAIRTLEIERWNAKHRVDRIEASQYDEDGIVGSGGAGIRRDFVRKCPVDECRGFLSSDLVCGVCSVKACAECWQAMHAEGHQCTPEDVRTARVLERETRPCPRCAARISKVDGCNTIWCVSCNSAFMWHTGAPVTGPVHNVHYFEYLRRQQPPEAEAAVQPPVNEREVLTQLDLRLREVNPDDGSRLGRPLYEYNPIMAYRRYILRIQHMCMFRLARAEEPYTTRDLRLDYLLGHLSVEDLRQALRMRESKYHRQLAQRACYEKKIQEAQRVIRMLCAGNISPGDALTAIRLSQGTGNAALRDVATLYGGRPDYGPDDRDLRIM